MEKKRILLVDDDPEDQELFAEAIKEVYPEMECVIALGALEALQLLKEMEPLPSCIISDFNMPMTNGAQFLSILKKYEAFDRIPVIVYSTSKPTEDLMQLGAWKFVIKPATHSGLLNMLKELLTDLK